MFSRERSINAHKSVLVIRQRSAANSKRASGLPKRGFRILIFHFTVANFAAASAFCNIWFSAG
jgi:hypothetical protein